VHASRKQRRYVTGLVLSNDGRVTLGRERKRKISATVHRFKKGELEEKEILSLKGTLAFAFSIEPKFLTWLTKKYGHRTLSALGC
jgi:hypothetical protein